MTRKRSSRTRLGGALRAYDDASSPQVEPGNGNVLDDESPGIGEASSQTTTGGETSIHGPGLEEMRGTTEPKPQSSQEQQDQSCNNLAVLV